MRRHWCAAAFFFAMNKRFRHSVWTVICLLPFCLCMKSDLRDQKPLADNAELHVVILGDSNSSIGGDDCDRPEGWTKWFCECLQPASCHSYARSGATWTHTPNTIRDEQLNTGKLHNNNVVYNQVCRLLTAFRQGQQPKPDLIVIAAGTNDAWFAKRRPHALDDLTAADTSGLLLRQPSTLLSLSDAVCYNCLLLHRHFPDARIVLLTPMQCTATSEQRIKTTGDIIANCANALSLSYIRQDSLCCLIRSDELKQHRYTVDGIHTNATGAEINGLRLCEVINSIL